MAEVAPVARLLLALATFALAGCTCERDRGPTAAPTGPVPAEARKPALAAVSERADSYDITEHLSACEIRHRGLSIDVGTRAAEFRRTYAVPPFSDVVAHERAGATFGRMLARAVSYDFWLDEPEQNIVVSMRAHGGTSQFVSVELDAKRVGSAKLTRGETRLVSLPATKNELAAGRHVLTLRFSGRATPGEAFAEIDWIRLSVQDDVAATYAAPTLVDVVTDVVLGGEPRRSVVLRAPSMLRCPLQPTSDARLRVMLGYWGEGSGDAELRLVRDGEPSITVQQRKVQGGAGAKWMPVEVDLGPYAGQIVGLELRVSAASGGGRVVFGEPTIVRQ